MVSLLKSKPSTIFFIQSVSWLIPFQWNRFRSVNSRYCTGSGCSSRIVSLRRALQFHLDRSAQISNINFCKTSKVERSRYNCTWKEGRSCSCSRRSYSKYQRYSECGQGLEECTNVSDLRSRNVPVQYHASRVSAGIDLSVVNCCLWLITDLIIHTTFNEAFLSRRKIVPSSPFLVHCSFAEVVDAQYVASSISQEYCHFGTADCPPACFVAQRF